MVLPLFHTTVVLKALETMKTLVFKKSFVGAHSLILCAGGKAEEGLLRY